jgi:hypothetical protein
MRPKRRQRLESFPHVAVNVTAGYCSFSYHHPWVDRINPDFAWTEFLANVRVIASTAALVAL